MHLYTIPTLYMKQIQRTICQDEDETKHLQDLTQIVVYPPFVPSSCSFRGQWSPRKSAAFFGWFLWEVYL